MAGQKADWYGVFPFVPTKNPTRGRGVTQKEMKSRLVILPIDSVLDLFKDYAGLIAVPDDAEATKLIMNPSLRKLGLVVDAESYNGPQPTEEIRFDLQRTFLVN